MVNTAPTSCSFLHLLLLAATTTVTDTDVATDNGQAVVTGNHSEASAMFTVVECVPHFGT